MAWYIGDFYFRPCPGLAKAARAKDRAKGKKNSSYEYKSPVDTIDLHGNLHKIVA